MIDDLVRAGELSRLDVQFASAMARIGQVDSPGTRLAFALACRAPAAGDVCVRLGDVGIDGHTFPDPAAWVEAVRDARAVVRTPDELRATPLVLDGGDLYLDRYWAYEERLAAAIGRLAGRVAGPAPGLKPLLERLFPTDPRTVRQREAVSTMAMRSLSIVTGGPGTGKTSVVVKLLVLLRHLGETPRVRLVAPTGKAAARLSESIRKTAADPRWIPRDLQVELDVEASTIHAALGSFGPSVPRFRHGRDNPLPLDVLVVDEASMAPLPLMAKLLEAVPTGARTILLGDPNQLVSVEAGSVLGDLCRAADAGAAPLAGARVHLEHVWRYDERSGLGRFARAVVADDADAALAALHDPSAPDLEQHVLDHPKQLEPLLVELVVPAFAGLAGAAPAEALQALERCRVLCAHREGARGVGRVNAIVEAGLGTRGCITPTEPWYPGRPVLVTRNAGDLGLYNGDTGVILADPSREGGRLAWFPSVSGPRRFGPAGLPEHETVYATTIHKSQGSEFAEVVVVLPEHDSPLLTRELLYTAVTRAAERVRLVGSNDVIRSAIRRRTERRTGLVAKLCALGSLSVQGRP